MRGIAASGVDGFYLTGETRGELPACAASGASTDYFIARFDQDGIRQWIKQDGKSGSYIMNVPEDIASDSSGNVYLTLWPRFTFGTFPEGNYHYLVKYTKKGVIKYYRQLPNSSVLTFHVAVDDMQNAYITGFNNWYEDQIAFADTYILDSRKSNDVEP